MTTRCDVGPARHQLKGRCEALLTEHPNGLPADKQSEFDSLVSAAKILDQVGTATMLGIDMANVSISSDGALVNRRRADTSDVYEAGRERQASAASPRQRTGALRCEVLFGDPNPSKMGFSSIEDVARAISLGDSQRTMMLSGASTGVPSDGGFLVPESFMFDTLDKSLENEIVRPRCRVEPMTTPTKSISTYDDSTHASGQLYGGLNAQWIEEGGEISYEFAKVRQIKLEARKMVFLTAASNELLQDAPSYSSGLTGRLTAALNWNIDRVTLATGTGAGQPKAIMHDTALITVQKETSQPADTIVWENRFNHHFGGLRL